MKKNIVDFFIQYKYGDFNHKCYKGFSYLTLSKCSQYMITGGAEHLSNEALKLQITWARQV